MTKTPPIIFLTGHGSAIGRDRVARSER